jgi:hypothetical protein
LSIYYINLSHTAFLVLLGISTSAIAIVLYKKMQEAQLYLLKCTANHVPEHESGAKVGHMSLERSKELFYKEDTPSRLELDRRKRLKLRDVEDNKKRWPCPPPPLSPKRETVIDYYEKHLRSEAGDTESRANKARQSNDGQVDDDNRDILTEEDDDTRADVTTIPSSASAVTVIAVPCCLADDEEAPTHLCTKI